MLIVEFTIYVIEIIFVLCKNSDLHNINKWSKISIIMKICVDISYYLSIDVFYKFFEICLIRN